MKEIDLQSLQIGDISMCVSCAEQFSMAHNTVALY